MRYNPEDDFSQGNNEEDQNLPIIPYTNSLATTPTQNEPVGFPNTALGDVRQPEPDPIEDDDVIDATWRYVNPDADAARRSARGPSVSSIDPDRPPAGDGGSRRNPFTGAGAARTEGAPRRTRDEELERAAVERSGMKATMKKVVQGMLVISMALGSGLVYGKLQSDLNNTKPPSGENTKFNGKNTNSLLGLSEEFKVIPLDSPDWYAYPSPMRDANGQEIEGRYEIVTTTGEKYSTFPGIPIGRRFYHRIDTRDGIIYLVEDPGVTFSFARAIPKASN